MLPLLGEGKGDTEKPKEDPLIAAMKFVKVPKGTSWMGWRSDKKESKPAEIKEDFELAAYTVTQEQWESVMGTNPSYFSRKGERKDKVKGVSDADLKRFPVEGVSWDDVQAFLKKLNEREKGKGWAYRLPTEAEWEYACRGAVATKEECSFDFYLDKPSNDLSSTQANFNGDHPAGKGAKGPNLDRPTKVGSYAPNKLGLYDMHGNLSQWCADSDKGFRLCRGSNWGHSGRFCGAAAQRDWLAAAQPLDYVGFRLARVPSGSK
jgi:formylglycine-generating enzyme required for sulfatase activity